MDAHRNITKSTGFPQIFDLKAKGGNFKGLRLLDRRSTALQIELVDAAIRRCETIAKELGVQPDSSTMIDLLHREEALGPYLNQYPDAALLAFAIAKGDAAHYRALRTAKWNVFSIKSFMKSFGVPAVLILLTALLGQAIGTSLQDRSFRRQRLFDLKRDRLVQGQQRAVDLYNDLERLKSALAIRERNGTILAADRSDITDYKARLEGLRALSESLVEAKEMDVVLVEAGNELKSYADCLTAKGTQRGDPSCARSFDLMKFKQVIYAFSDALISFMEQPVSAEGASVKTTP